MFLLPEAAWTLASGAGGVPLQRDGYWHRQIRFCLAVPGLSEPMSIVLRDRPSLFPFLPAILPSLVGLSGIPEQMDQRTNPQTTPEGLFPDPRALQLHL